MVLPAQDAPHRWTPLFAAAERLANARSLEDVVEVVRTAARVIAGAQGITVVLAEGDDCIYVAEDAVEPLWKGQRFPRSACVSGWVMAHGEAAVIPDIFADARVPHQLYADTFVRSMVMTPVETGSQPMAIGAYWSRANAPDDFSVDLLGQLARLVGAAVRNVSLQTSFEIINRIGAAVAAESNLDIVVQTITDAAVELTGAEFGAFFYNLIGQQGESYMLYSLSGVPREAFADFPMPRNTAVFAPTFLGEGIVRSDDIRQDARYGHNAPHKGMPPGHLPVTSYLAVPVISQSGEVQGGLFFGHHLPGRFTAEHEKIMTGVAGHASIAIDNARLHHKAQREIAARTVAEGELRQLNATLEQRIEQRTEQIRAAFSELEQSERRFGLLVQGVTDYAMCMLDANGTITNWNAGAERIKGYTAHEIVGRHFSCFYTDPDQQAGMPAHTLQVAASAGRFEAEGWRVRKDGSEFWASIIVDAIHDDQGRLIGFAKVTRDLTEKRAVEEQLRQAQKMEAVGQLTGGIAHDFNNLLTVINGNIELAQRNLETGSDPAKISRAIANARQGAERAASLTQRLLAFSRRQPLSPKPLYLDRVVDGLSDLLKRALGELIELKTVSGPHLWLVEADPNQIESTLLNLAVNARDAMADGGTLTIETGNAHLDSGYTAACGDVTPGNYVMIAVSDTGTGMAPPVLTRIFEPFFTTKEIGRGTGLGLSQVYGFVKQSGGHVEVLSKQGQGTTVKIYLPRFIGEADEAREEKAAAHDLSANGETILVVEDDDGVRAYSVETLRELGYRALEAADGNAALRLIEAEDQPIDLLFTDVVMPGMSGKELSEKARALRPDLKILYTSGYTRDGFLRDGKLDPGISLLAKPFTLQELASRLRDLIDQS
ncbi:GAF domain-containing hybrid sensor histidine kinase/response regulator [Sphingobium sp. Cam5-1]|uniref:GAF domain-containing hybrid sensor histidine kinase/response regulator n=1 Tax=Sphingobium sp. Cam5-1 TaxID=2789327 RepID=UPI001E394E88|nr:GAF domain-containing protein [Sphingobium sp. Cam5-1]